ncbi:hypothetical protein INS49_012308 [Diaporthe citri]|uniref:uncharacterized protein n=1 Tax=Diaporthe citri TaxID=83186 RepID=UPI001C809052|nr:uncharacterized protein INS49_012308 [Diaporthe citri]KAG6358789.1 hypothetical protein INS49_012308 [Diaporthe citri]
MPTEDSVSGLGGTLCVVFRHGGANSLTSIQLRPDVPVHEMTNILLGEYQGLPNAVPRHITSQVSEVATPEESVDLEAQPVQGQQAAITSQDPVRPLDPPLLSNNNSFTPEAHSSGAARQLPADGDIGSSRELTIRSRPTVKRIAVLIVAALSLVVVPGLVLGVATKQIPWGIALSGAIATV